MWIAFLCVNLIHPNLLLLATGAKTASSSLGSNLLRIGQTGRRQPKSSVFYGKFRTFLLFLHLFAQI